MEPTRRLDDDALAEEIEMYGDLVVAASESDGVLPQDEVDRLLGVHHDASADATTDPGSATGHGTGAAADVPADGPTEDA